MRYCLFFILSLLLVSCTGCNLDIKPVDLLSKMDARIPVLTASMMLTSRSGTILFDEEIGTIAEFDASPIPLAQASPNGTTITLVFQQSVQPGTSVTVTGKVKDKRGNSNRFSIRLWGKNAYPAGVLITEFTTKGTETNPDRVELYVTRSGSMGGIVVTDGSDRYVFPDKTVWAGEYLVVQFQKGKTLLEHHSEQLAGLTSNNGLLWICSSPDSDGQILDAVAYSNGAATYEGWGNETVQNRASWLVTQEAWTSKTSTDAIPSELTTATRSCNRWGTQDTNSKDDWYITTQSHATFGKPNWEEVYVP